MHKIFWEKYFEFNDDFGSLIFKPRQRSEFNGEASWKQWNSRYANKRAGYVLKKASKDYSFIAISFKGRTYRAHRIIAVIKGLISHYKDHVEIDHIDGDPTNNRPENLRAVSRLENTRNQKIHKTNRSGISGVFQQRDRPGWVAQIYIGNGKKLYLGTFDNLLDAAATRKSKEAELGYFKNHGLRA